MTAMPVSPSVSQTPLAPELERKVAAAYRKEPDLVEECRKILLENSKPVQQRIIDLTAWMGERMIPYNLEAGAPASDQKIICKQLGMHRRLKDLEDFVGGFPFDEQKVISWIEKEEAGGVRLSGETIRPLPADYEEDQARAFAAIDEMMNRTALACMGCPMIGLTDNLCRALKLTETEGRETAAGTLALAGYYRLSLAGHADALAAHLEGKAGKVLEVPEKWIESNGAVADNLFEQLLASADYAIDILGGVYGPVDSGLARKGIVQFLASTSETCARLVQFEEAGSSRRSRGKR